MRIWFVLNDRVEISFLCAIPTPPTQIYIGTHKHTHKTIDTQKQTQTGSLLNPIGRN